MADLGTEMGGATSKPPLHSKLPEKTAKAAEAPPKPADSVPPGSKVAATPVTGATASAASGTAASKDNITVSSSVVGKDKTTNSKTIDDLRQRISELEEQVNLTNYFKRSDTLSSDGGAKQS